MERKKETSVQNNVKVFKRENRETRSRCKPQLMKIKTNKQTKKNRRMGIENKTTWSEKNHGQISDVLIT